MADEAQDARPSRRTDYRSNQGLYKICPCKVWGRCQHGWHLNFQHKGTSYRFSLNRQLGHPVKSKSDAEADVHAPEDSDHLACGGRPGRGGPPAGPGMLCMSRTLNLCPIMTMSPGF